MQHGKQRAPQAFTGTNATRPLRRTPHPPTSSIRRDSRSLYSLSAPFSNPMSCSSVMRQLLSDMELREGEGRGAVCMRLAAAVAAAQLQRGGGLCHRLQRSCSDQRARVAPARRLLQASTKLQLSSLEV